MIPSGYLPKLAHSFFFPLISASLSFCTAIHVSSFIGIVVVVIRLPSNVVLYVVSWDMWDEPSCLAWHCSLSILPALQQSVLDTYTVVT